jgi:hypothetical protein
MSTELDELESAQVRFKKNGDLVQRIDGGEIVVAHYDRATGHLEFATKKASVDLYQQVTARIGSTNKGTETSGLVIKTFGIKGEARSAPAGKRPKMGPEGDGAPVFVHHMVTKEPPEAVIRYKIFTDANGEMVRKRVRRVIETTADRRETTDDRLPWIVTGAKTQEKSPVARDNKVVEVRNAIIGQRPTRYEDDPDVLDELGVDKLEAIFSPSEVVGGWTPEDEWADAPSAQEVDS